MEGSTSYLGGRLELETVVSARSLETIGSARSLGFGVQGSGLGV